MAAAHFGLGNLVAFIDKNDLSMDGRLNDIMRMNPIGDKFAAFGWNVVEVDGHAMAALVEVIDSLLDVMSKRPTVVVASTVKGKGVGFMETKVAWHAGAIDADTLKATVAEVEEKRQREREGVLNS
jgi:transketolase